MALQSNPYHPHDTRNHPGSAPAATAPVVVARNVAASGDAAVASAQGLNAQWTLGGPEEGARGGGPEEGFRGHYGAAATMQTMDPGHQFGPAVDGIIDEISSHPDRPVPVLREYSGFEVAMNKSGERMLEPVIVERELKWQREELLAENKEAREAFKDMMLQQQHFRAFALMTENSPFISIVHSIGKYFPPIEADYTEFKGRQIGFVGDRKQTRSPVPVVLPSEVWDWTIPEVYLDYDAVAEYYEDADNYSTFFTKPPSEKPTKGTGKRKAEAATTVLQREEVAVPFMLSLPSCVMAELAARTRWTPHELLEIVSKKIVDFDLQVETSHWKVMKEWCLSAAHSALKDSKTSAVAVQVLAVTDDEDELHEWITTRLDVTMGQRHFQSTHAGDHPANADTARMLSDHGHQGATGGEDLATQVGRGIAMGFQTFTNAGLLAQGAGVRAGVTPSGETTKIYSPDSIAALKGFSGTADVNELQPIWATFQTTKNLDVQRRHIAYGMEQWARTHGVELDRGIYFEQKTIEDIINLRFNPGQGVAQFKSAEKGLSLLVCRSRTPEEIERVREKEQAEQLTQATRVLEEALKLQRGDPRAPANSYLELKLNITSYCALLHTLFGGRCSYYQALMRIRNCMDTSGVYNIRQAYTAEVCHRISWAIIDDGRSFFSTVLIQQDFEGQGPIFPESLLDAILVDVRYANPIMRASFPHEWKPKANPPVPPQFQWTPPAGGALPPVRSGAAIPSAVPTPSRANNQWVDNRHPAIVSLMAPYIAKFGDNVYVGEILDASGIRLSDLPVPSGTRFASKDGKATYLCWNAVLGRCKFGAKCKYKRNHPAASELPDSYASAVVSALTAGVAHVVATKEASPKKVKQEVVVLA